MGKYDDLDTSRMDPEMRKMIESGKALEQCGEKISNASSSLADAGVGMTIGCMLPVLVIGGLVLLLIILFI